MTQRADVKKLKQIWSIMVKLSDHHKNSSNNYTRMICIGYLYKYFIETVKISNFIDYF